jgi:endonuclease G
MRASIPFLTLVASLACAVSAPGQDCRRLLLGGVAPELTGRAPALTTLVCRQAYEALVSDQAREPLWSAERLALPFRSQQLGHWHRASFRAELLVPPAVRAEPWDYGHGYDRGHMTPAGDVAPGPARQETYSLANVVPQASRLNRGKWERLEKRVRRLARRDGPLFVVTGPVVAAGDSRTWNGTVDIPAATWKAVYDPVTRRTFAWICSNTAEPICAAASIAGIEHIAGVDPFPVLEQAQDRDSFLGFPQRYLRRSGRHRARPSASASAPA